NADTMTGTDLEMVIAEAIRASGVTTVSQGAAERNYADLAVWSDDLSPWVGNPLAIELRLNLRGPADVNRAAGKLVQGMARGNMQWGLLIYLRSEVDVPSAVAVPNVIPISAEQFLESLRHTSFGDLIYQYRNQRVHGGC